MILAELFPYAHIVFMVLAALYAVTILSIIGVIISENRNPIKSLAWVVVLILLPVLGLLLYLFFGRSLKGVHLISRANSRKLVANARLRTIDTSKLKLSDSSKQIIHLVNTIGEPQYFAGNHIDIFTEGHDKFEALKRDLRQAQQFIHFEYYIFANDKIGHEVAQILIDKAHEGVKVRVIYDHVGSLGIASSFYQKLRQEGVEAYPFLRVTPTQLANRLNWRDHRKLVIVDGKVGYIGGMNVADRYVTGSRRQQPWRDTHLRVTGGAVMAMEYVFAVDWNFMNRTLLTEQCDYPVADDNAPDGMQVVGSGPTGLWNGMSMVLLRAISLAKQCIYIQTPYFLPNDGQVKALQAAALAGVDVRVMIPRHPDSRLLRYSSFSYVKECLQAGVKVYLYEPRMLHVKCVIVDGEFVTTGSTNFDFRSFEHDFECNALIYSTDFNRRMKQVFARDQQSCTQVSLATWVKRPMPQRALESLARLLSPLL